jgi:hypothetical protein
MAAVEGGRELKIDALLPVILAVAVTGAAVTAPSCSRKSPGPALPDATHDLVFERLAETWDEGIPLGNGEIGALVWKKGQALRLSLDRADLWDLRPVPQFAGPNFRFSWVVDQVLRKDYDPVHLMGDVPYDALPAPTKIPAAALEFDIEGLGEIESVRLSVRGAVCLVNWRNGASFRTFVHATEPVGWFRFSGVPDRSGETPLGLRLVPPAYSEAGSGGGREDVVSGKSLASLGYPPPVVRSEGRSIRYRQEGWDGMSYTVSVEWASRGEGSIVGSWRVESAARAGSPSRARRREGDEDDAPGARKRSFEEDIGTHLRWWRDYWAKSTIRIPDPVLEKQWVLETYKFGSSSRRGAPPITLQAVWTADNGGLPPWKGDFHNDLNTQLSYWPCYSGNRLEEGRAFLDWLWEIKPQAETYTKTYFGVDGLNVPGVCDLEGKPMGGWIQYSLGPTVSAWLAHHFDLHWQYSRDRDFLRDRAYPWLRAVAVFLDRIATRKTDGKRNLPLSSSPEINDNRIDAWFQETTNFDLALIRWLYGAAAELAGELGLADEAARWRTILGEWPKLALSEDDGRLLVAPGYPLRESHRHFSHLMAIHPLGLVDWSGGEADRKTIRAALDELERLGPDWWCGYSYSWLGNLAARARDGDRAARALKTFAECFCLPNSFHVNGDQCRAGHSRYTYRPFTLEGNFAFAAAVQEMLLQSHAGVVRVFPAVPEAWKDAAFASLRARGAFLVSARKADGRVVEIEVVSEKGGTLKIENPFGEKAYRISDLAAGRVRDVGGVIEADMRPGDRLLLRRR